MILPRIGIDPGLSGCISIIENGKLLNFRMPESLRDIREILKPYGGHPNDTEKRCAVEKLNIRPMGNPFMNARMQPMITNYNRIQDALIDCNIPFQLVSPATWIKFHNLKLPKGQGEKGMNYDELSEFDKDTRHLQTHLKIENNVKNDEVINGDVKHILETNGKFEARKMLRDDYLYLSKYDLKKAIIEVEDQTKKFRSKEKTIRKGRYKDYANKIYIKSLIGDDKNRINKLQNDLGIELNGFFYNNVGITPAEIRKLFKLYNLKPLTLAECDAVLLLLYQMNS